MQDSWAPSLVSGMFTEHKYGVFARCRVRAGDTAEKEMDKVPCMRGTCTRGEGFCLPPSILDLVLGGVAAEGQRTPS